MFIHLAVFLSHNQIHTLFFFRLYYGKTVLARNQRKAATVIPFHDELSSVIHRLHLTFGARWNRRIGVIHGIKANAGSCGYRALIRSTCSLDGNPFILHASKLHFIDLL